MRFSLLLTFALAACGPGRTTFARYPGAAIVFDRNASDPKAVAIADRVIAAAGGAERWAQAKQIRWSETIKDGDKVLAAGEEAWDRWDGRHYGRLHTPDDSDMIVMRNIYQVTAGAAYIERGRAKEKLGDTDTKNAMKSAIERWQFDTAVLCMPFLLEEPGVKLVYAGEREGTDGKGPLDDLEVRFDPKDGTRTATYHVIVNRETNLIDRIEVAKGGDAMRIAYQVSKWVDAGGLKLPTSFQNIGYAAEVVTFKDVSVTAEPEDILYVPQVN